MCPPAATQEESSTPPAANNKTLDRKDFPNHAAMSTGSLDLKTCTPKALAEYLLHHRFADNHSQAQAFLQSTTKVVAKTLAVSDTLPQTSDLGTAFLAEPLETSLILPRSGKFGIQFHSNGLLATKLNDKSVTLFVPNKQVSHAILFPKPEDIKTICNVTNSKNPKPPNAHMVLFYLSRPIIFENSKPVHQVCFPLSWSKTEGGPTGPKRIEDVDQSGDDDNDDTEDESTKSSGWESPTLAWKKIIQKSFPNSIFTQVHPTKSKPFKSFSDPSQSTTTGNMPFIKCYHGVQDGVLYPLEEGLLFFKPPKFIPRSELHSIACGRGQQNASRYVDIRVELNDKTPVEFTNIQREEVAVVNQYIHKVLIPAMQRDVKQQSGGQGGESTDGSATKNDDAEDDTEEEGQEPVQIYSDDESDDDDDDENFVVEEESDKDNENDDENEETDDENDDDENEVEIVEDDFAQELAKRKQGDSDDTESESEVPKSKRKRRGR